MSIFLTGANGFVGKYLCSELKARGIPFQAGVQLLPAEPNGYVSTGPLEKPTADLSAIIKGSRVVIHLAGFAHENSGTSESTAAKMALSNEKATENMLQACRIAGVRRFIYLSSVKACAEFSEGSPINEETVDVPSTLYGQSKLATEKLVEKICEADGMEYIILRPTLIYGPNAKANFLSLLRLADRCPVLPFKSQSPKNFCYVGNLTDAIIRIVETDRFGNRPYYIADVEAVSPSELFEMIARKIHGWAFCVGIPKIFYCLLSKALDDGRFYQKIFSDLEVSSALLCEYLQWTQPFSLKIGLEKTIGWYQSQNQKLGSHEQLHTTNHPVSLK